MENLYSILERNKPYCISFDSRAEARCVEPLIGSKFEGAPNMSATYERKE